MSIPDNAPIEQWLGQQTPEPVLEPDLPIIDPHHHLWDIRGSEVPLLKTFKQKVYLCEELTNDITASGHNIVQTVFAECSAFYRASGPKAMRAVGETEFVNGVAAMSRSGLYGKPRLCTGIFGSADLRLGKDAEPVLQAHMQASDNFRGIRSAFPSDLNDQFLEGFALLAKHNLSFDNYAPNFDRLDRLAQLAATQPDVTVIVNHLGGTIDRSADEAQTKLWQDAITTIAAQPNAVMKTGGVQMRVARGEPSFHMNKRPAPIGSEELCDMLFPYYQFIIDAFGPDRCMFESNFPVDKECVSYRTLWNTFKRIAARLGLSDGDKTHMFSGTAARAYRLEAPAAN